METLGRADGGLSGLTSERCRRLLTRIRVAKPINEPLSGTIDFWGRWSDDKSGAALDKAVKSWRGRHW
tara:strand:+ start:125 stop:328 length:204 start_codon:yes stop_codon:yes gene_type:complete